MLAATLPCDRTDDEDEPLYVLADPPDIPSVFLSAPNSEHGHRPTPPDVLRRWLLNAARRKRALCRYSRPAHVIMVFMLQYG